MQLLQSRISIALQNLAVVQLETYLYFTAWLVLEVFSSSWASASALRSDTEASSMGRDLIFIMRCARTGRLASYLQALIGYSLIEAMPLGSLLNHGAPD